MKLAVIAVGKLKEPAYRALADEYLGRVRRYVRADEVEVKDAAALGRAVPDDALVVALEVDGERLTSEAFAKKLEQWGSRGKGSVAFLIGGADGIPAELSRAAAVRLSLSSMTLPHRLARVVLLEQLYRGLSILKGEPYARE
ncbi:MAG: 23S rRNA (pseudouridine(1915)-N(3))-methyltransferase RlmH [Myxococcales bacterium]|nr:23S rRNA (pseudouridine(1915)-N(3))-methyltransferase RlmH [Myxococcales bacterium]